MSSGYYKALMDKCDQIIQGVSGLYSYLGSCSNNISQCKPLIDKTIIDNETIDKGKIDNVSSTLSHLRGVFDTVIAECTVKRELYETLYRAALQAEEEERRKKQTAV